MENSDRLHYLTSKMLPWAIPVLLAVVALVSIFFRLQSSAGWDTLITDSSSHIDAITFDASGRAWFGANDVINVYDGETQTIHDPGLAFGWAHVIAFDPEGNPWVGGLGLYVFDGENWKTYTTDNSKLVHNTVGSIAFDREGKVWIGTGGGIQVIDGETWTTYTKDNSGNVYTDGGFPRIVIGPSGRVWIGTNNGVDIFDGDNWTTYNTGNSELAQDRVFAIAFDSEGKAWIGAGGINIFDGNTWTTYTSANSDLINNAVFHIAFDPAGRAWIGTGHGISVFDGETWINFTKDNSGLPGNRVFEIAIDPSGRAWIGLKCFENGSEDKLVLAPTGENLTNPNLVPESFIQYRFFFGALIFLIIIGLAILYIKLTLKISSETITSIVRSLLTSLLTGLVVGPIVCCVGIFFLGAYTNVIMYFTLAICSAAIGAIISARRVRGSDVDPSVGALIGAVVSLICYFLTPFLLYGMGLISQ